MLERASGSVNAMQVTALKLVMRRGSQITYDYGIIDMIMPDGPAQALGIGDYDEVSP